MMDHKRILTVQDISCVGQCSMTVALPVLSACGVETCVLPTAVLSTHTGGFGAVHFEDLTDSLAPIISHWTRESITFDCVHVGYLGSAKQIDLVKTALPQLLGQGGFSVIDPVMGDHGKLYTGFDENYVERMRSLCGSADVLLPNITEACLLTQNHYQCTFDRSWYVMLLMDLQRLGAKSIVLTGVSPQPGKTGVMVLENGVVNEFFHNEVDGACHGTGDLFASVLTGAMSRGKSLMDAARLAGEFTAKCVAETKSAPAHWYGIQFEPFLADLIRMLNE